MTAVVDRPLGMGSLQRTPRPSNRLGIGTALTIPVPLDAFDFSLAYRPTH